MIEQINEVPLAGETIEKLTTAIEQLIPKSLDDIIRKNRDLVQLRLATDEEIFALHQVITPGQPKDVIAEWNLIALHQPAFSNVQIFLLGDVSSSDQQRVTSEVVGIDLDRQLVVTKSGSLYQLIGSPKNGDPDPQQLMCICSVFHEWGFGEKLGVPHFFY